MDWLNPYLVLLLPVAAGLVLLVALMLLALAGPAWEEKTGDQAVIFVMDHSHSQGEVGQKRACERAKGLAGALPSGTYVGIVSAGTAPVVRAMPTRSRGELEPALEPDQGLAETGGAETNLADAVALAGGLFPPGT
ncbi:MAG: vWA domain-containing protein, partial [Planctomycetota bacterium]